MSITPQLKDKFMILGTLLRSSMGCEEKKPKNQIKYLI